MLDNCNVPPLYVLIDFFLQYSLALAYTNAKTQLFKIFVKNNEIVSLYSWYIVRSRAGVKPVTL